MISPSGILTMNRTEVLGTVDKNFNLGEIPLIADCNKLIINLVLKKHLFTFQTVFLTEKSCNSCKHLKLKLSVRKRNVKTVILRTLIFSAKSQLFKF